MNYIKHLFAPHTTNNFRAKILHHSFLIVFIIGFLSLSCGVFVVKKSHPQVLGISYTISEAELLDATNKQRVLHGVEPLNLNQNLSNAARQKASFMFEKNFWAHFAPDGTTPWSFIKSSGYEYLFAGENLAKGFTNSSEVVDAWMNSPTHRENLLSTKYKDMGFAIQEGNLTGEDTVLVVQMFGTPLSANSEVTNVPQSPPAQQIAQEEVNAPAVAVKSEQQSAIPVENVSKPLIDAPTTTKSLSVIFLFFIIAILVLDLCIVEKKRLPRILGHNLDHIIILVLFLLLILLDKTGGIL